MCNVERVNGCDKFTGISGSYPGLFVSPLDMNIKKEYVLLLLRAVQLEQLVLLIGSF